MSDTIPKGLLGQTSGKGEGEKRLTDCAQIESEHGNLLLISKSGSAKSHPVETQTYLSRAKINQNNLLLDSSSCHVDGGGMILVRLKLGIGVRPSQGFGSSSVDNPRCTADRVRRARIPQLLGP